MIDRKEAETIVWDLYFGLYNLTYIPKTKATNAEVKEHVIKALIAYSEVEP
mgnify:CR=1 FL=1